MVEIERKHLNAMALLKSPEIFSSGLGKNVRISMENDYSVYRNEEIWDEDFSGFLYNYIFKKSQNVRILTQFPDILYRGLFSIVFFSVILNSYIFLNG